MLDEAETLWAIAGLSGSLHLERFGAALGGGEAEGWASTWRSRVVDVREAFAGVTARRPGSPRGQTWSRGMVRRQLSAYTRSDPS
ncbi:hypothetical protein GCM10009609_34530 [Pseudonocardia aurantiaca]